MYLSILVIFSVTVRLFVSHLNNKIERERKREKGGGRKKITFHIGSSQK